MPHADSGARISSGVSALDEVLGGGLIPRRRYLVRGGPGQGKTTLGLSFLAAAQDDESALFIGFQEPEDEIRANAASVGVELNGLRFLNLAPDDQFFAGGQAYDVFAAADVEQEPLVDAVVKAVEESRPTRVFVDSLTQLRFLSADIYQYRKQVLSFLTFLTDRGSTVLFSSENSKEVPDDDLQFLADGVITLDTAERGSYVHVSKYRGSAFQRGHHQVRVGAGGIRVFPRPEPPPIRLVDADHRPWSSGIESIDAMLAGGLEAGTISLISGPTGIGKSTFAALFATEAARNGYASAVFLFEEEISTYFARLKALQIPARDVWDKGLLTVEQVEPMRELADEFAERVRSSIESNQTQVVVLDSIAGFELGLDGADVRTRLHAFSKALARMGVAVILVNETDAGETGLSSTERGISYMADNVVYLRYNRDGARVQRGLGVLKKRLSDMDPTFRELVIGPVAMHAGDPIAQED